MNHPSVAITDSVFPSLDPAAAALAEIDARIVVAKSASAEDILEAAADADGVLVTYAKLTAEVIAGLRRCKVIGRFGIGVDNLDIAAATAKGIAVTYVPDYCVQEVADHAMALLLTMARKITMSNSLVQGGRWEMPAVVPIRRLSGLTLGLVGLGNIPRCVVPKARAFGLRVVAADPFVGEEAFASLGVERLDFDDLLAVSDFVSVHAPLTPATRNLFNAGTFRRMKRGAVLINTARGPLVDDAALAEALDAGLIGGAALDVVSVEPLPADSPLVGRDNVILTPHTGFYSEQALQELQTKAATDVARVLSGKRPIYPINPEVFT